MKIKKCKCVVCVMNEKTGNKSQIVKKWAKKQGVKVIDIKLSKVNASDFIMPEVIRK